MTSGQLLQSNPPPRGHSWGGILAVVVASFVVLTLCCFAAQAIGLEAALGAFAAGLILSASTHTHEIDAAVKPLVALFATVFFVRSAPTWICRCSTRWIRPTGKARRRWPR